MTHIDTSSHHGPAQTPVAMSQSASNCDFSCSPFALLMDESRQKQSTLTSAELFAAAMNPDDDRQKRQQKHTIRQLTQDFGESVNSVGVPSEKRQDAGCANFSNQENDERRHKTHTSGFNENSEQKRQSERQENDTNHRNHKGIAAAAFASSPIGNIVSASSIAALALPEAEFRKLVRVLRNTSLSKRTSVFLTLDLKEMGEVKLDVTLKAKKLFITAHITDRRAAAALSYAIGELKRQLAEIDLTLEKFEIAAGYNDTTASDGHSPADAVCAVRTGI